MKLLVFLLVCYGVTNIVTLGRIFAPVRALLLRLSPTAGYWIKCPMCFGLPVGVAWALLGLWPPTGMHRALDVAAAAAASSGFSWILRVVLHRLGEDDL